MCFPTLRSFKCFAEPIIGVTKPEYRQGTTGPLTTVLTIQRYSKLELVSIELDQAWTSKAWEKFQTARRLSEFYAEKMTKSSKLFLDFFSL